MVRLTDRPDMTLDVYRGRKTIQQQQLTFKSTNTHAMLSAYYLWQLSAGKAVTSRHLPYFYHLITLDLHLLNYITRN